MVVIGPGHQWLIVGLAFLTKTSKDLLRLEGNRRTSKLLVVEKFGIPGYA